MKITRPFAWLNKWTGAVQQPVALDLIEVIQPTIDCACDWPLTNEFDVKLHDTTLPAGTNEIIFTVPKGKHALIMACNVVPGASLAVNVLWQDSETAAHAIVLNKSAAATNHTIINSVPRPIILGHGWDSINIQILAAAGTEEPDIRVVWWLRDESKPLIL